MTVSLLSFVTLLQKIQELFVVNENIDRDRIWYLCFVHSFSIILAHTAVMVFNVLLLLHFFIYKGIMQNRDINRKSLLVKNTTPVIQTIVIAVFIVYQHFVCQIYLQIYLVVCVTYISVFH